MEAPGASRKAGGQNREQGPPAMIGSEAPLQVERGRSPHLTSEGWGQNSSSSLHQLCDVGEVASPLCAIVSTRREGRVAARLD